MNIKQPELREYTASVRLEFTVKGVNEKHAAFNVFQKLEDEMTYGLLFVY